MEFYFFAFLQVFALIGLFIGFMACVQVVHFLCDLEAYDDHD